MAINLSENNGNGWCDVCEAPIIVIAPDLPRVCSKDELHDAYSDNFSNGGDPTFVELMGELDPDAEWF